jgi:glycogen debranching enzyme
MKAPLNRRRFLARAGMCGVGLLSFRLKRADATEASSHTAGPELHFEKPELETLHGTAFKHALKNLLVTNTMPDAQKQYNRTGLFADPPGRFIRAGGNYATPWTRDASINSWNAASLLSPAVARNTLWAVCERQANGRLIIQRDNQWWDKLIWAQGAWTHFLVTGDRGFLERAYEAVTESLAEMRRTRFNERRGLFEGPSVLCDGIAGYPEPPYDPKVASSFILDHPGGDKVMCLSTNCVSYQAHRCAAWMAGQLGRPAEEMAPFTESAAQLRAAIHRHFWMPAKSTFGYFIHGTGPLAGKLDGSQEGMGLAYAILFDVADAAQVRSIMRTVHLQPKGLVCAWPHFARFSDARPGRHNVLVWPMASGMWAHAAARAGAVERFATEMTNIAAMANASDGIFYEIYHSVTGAPDGGWQVGRHWESCIHQTWSATGYLRMVFHGLFGLNFELDGVRLTPTLPPGWGAVRLRGLRYRQAILNLRLEGEGQHIASVSVDDKNVPAARLSANLTGEHQIAIRLRPA